MKHGISMVLICVIAVFCMRYSMLQKSDEPSGLDGYYYALQAKSFVQTGHFENPDYKLGYYFCAASTALCDDPIKGCKLWSAAAGALLAWGVFTLLYTMGVSFELALLGLLLCGSSYTLASLSINYINNLTGLAFFVWYTASLIRLLRYREKYVLPVAILLFVGCIFSHLISAVFALLTTLIGLLRILPRKKQAIVLIVAILAFFSIAVTQYGRFARVFALLPVLPVCSDFMIRAAGKRICIEISVLFVASWISALYVCMKDSTGHRFDISVLCVPVFFFPFWNLQTLDMGYRLLMSAVPFGIVVVILSLHFLFQRIPFHFVKTICSTVCVGLFIALFTSPNAYNPQHDPPYKYYQKVIQSIDLTDDSLLIAHLPLNHVYTYYNYFRDSLNYVPDFDVPDEKLWRLCYGVDPNALPDDVPYKQIDSRYLLLKESDWQRYLANEDESVVETYQNWYNPYKVRPQFIRRSKARRH